MRFSANGYYAERYVKCANCGLYFACYDIMSGGWGGRFGHNGNDCVIAINGNCRFNPTEVFETRFPLLVEDCALIPDSGGAGQWRGGLGYTRTLRLKRVPITGSQCSDRHEVRPFALFGGQQGGNGGTLIEEDLREGSVLAASAERDYGYTRAGAGAA
jgi:N-methylhydantoinase B